jgi:hypothetical protein
MDWLQHLVALASAIVGGVLVIVGDRWRTGHDANMRRAESVVCLYTNFLVAFQAALHANESFWNGIIFECEGKGSYKESEESRAKRIKAESNFRDAAWTLRLRERDTAQQARIEAIVVAFDDDPDDYGGMMDYAFIYSNLANKLRDDVRTIINEMQQIHRKKLSLA